MKFYVDTKCKLYTITYREWQEGTSGFSGDGQWGEDFADELLGDTSLPLLPGTDIHEGTEEDLEAMFDFLREDSEAEKAEGHEWSIDVGEEPYAADGWHDTVKGRVYVEDGFVTRAMRHDCNGGWVSAAVYEAVSDGFSYAGDVPFEDFIRCGKYMIQ